MKRTGPPSSHAVRTVGEHDIGRVAERGAERDGPIDEPPPRRLGIAPVDGVRPHEMVQLVAIEGESCTQLVDRSALDGSGRLP